MKSKQAEQETLTCRCVGVYRDALTRGKHYLALSYNPDEQQFRLRGDNGRSRWFPAGSFDPGEVEVPCLSSFEILDELEMADDNFIEVDVTLTTGERRWCWSAPPSALSKRGDLLNDTNVRFHYRPHLIVASTLTKEIIGGILKEIDDQDELASTTLAFDTE